MHTFTTFIRKFSSIKMQAQATDRWHGSVR